MQIKAIVMTAAFFGLTAISAANATCAANPTGVWDFFATETYPGATSKANVITCNLAFGSAGAFTGSCKNYFTGQGTVENTSISGTFTMHSACDFTGSITTEQAPVTIRDGHINGNIGSGIATQATGAQARAILFTLLRR
jgi:hypothetical protein